MSEATLLLDALPRPGQRPAAPNLKRGQVVTSRTSGRRMRVLKTDEWVNSAHWEQPGHAEASRAEIARRNHPMNKSLELARLVQLKGAITRQVNRIAREAAQKEPA